MGNCTYCGQPAGLLRYRHKKCEAKRNEGWSHMLAVATDSAIGKVPLDTIEARLNEIAKSSFVPLSRVQEAMIRGWERAVDHFLEDGHLDEAEEQHLYRFLTHFSLSQNQVDERGAYSRLVKALVLRDVMHGVVPERVEIQGNLPFNFQRTERLVWCFPETKYYEHRKRRHYVGRSHGLSFRIAK